MNLGIIYNQLGDQEKSNINHQFALRYAVQMSSIPGQKIALGNLGKIGSYNFSSDAEKLLNFVENYLDLSGKKQKAQDPNAYLKLGQILSIKGKFDESSKQFFKAISIAEKDGDKSTKNEAVINFGMANANLKWEDKCKEIAEQIQTFGDEADKLDKEDEIDDIQEMLNKELEKAQDDQIVDDQIVNSSKDPTSTS